MRRVTRLRWGLSVLLALGTCTVGLLPVDTATARPSTPHPLPRPGHRHAAGPRPHRVAGPRQGRAWRPGRRTRAAGRTGGGRTFGGSWYDPARGTLIIGVTDTGTAAADTVEPPAPRSYRSRTAPGRWTRPRPPSTTPPRRTAPPQPSAVAGMSTPRQHPGGREVRRGAEHSAAVTAFLAPAREAGLLTVHTSATAQTPRTFSRGTSAATRTTSTATPAAP